MYANKNITLKQPALVYSILNTNNVFMRISCCKGRVYYLWFCKYFHVTDLIHKQNYTCTSICSPFTDLSVVGRR